MVWHNTVPLQRDFSVVMLHVLFVIYWEIKRLANGNSGVSLQSQY